jgi:hypothetical protein
MFARDDWSTTTNAEMKPDNNSRAPMQANAVEPDARDGMDTVEVWEVQE